MNIFNRYSTKRTTDNEKLVQQLSNDKTFDTLSSIIDNIDSIPLDNPESRLDEWLYPSIENKDYLANMTEYFDCVSFKVTFENIIKTIEEYKKTLNTLRLNHKTIDSEINTLISEYTSNNERIKKFTTNQSD